MVGELHKTRKNGPIGLRPCVRLGLPQGLPGASIEDYEPSQGKGERGTMRLSWLIG